MLGKCPLCPLKVCQGLVAVAQIGATHKERASDFLSLLSLHQLLPKHLGSWQGVAHITHSESSLLSSWPVLKLPIWLQLCSCAVTWHHFRLHSWAPGPRRQNQIQVSIIMATAEAVCSQVLDVCLYLVSLSPSSLCLTCSFCLQLLASLQNTFSKAHSKMLRARSQIYKDLANHLEREICISKKE